MVDNDKVRCIMHYYSIKNFTPRSHTVYCTVYTQYGDLKLGLYLMADHLLKFITCIYPEPS